MIIYSETKRNFLTDIDKGELENKIDSAIKERLNRNTPQSEMRSWTNSLKHVETTLLKSTLPDNVGVAIEYNIPYTSKRVDVIISGYDDMGRNTAVIIELKQWERAECVEGKDAIVRTFINGGDHEITHPSYQAWSYATAISDFNADVQDKNVNLRPCVFLHNYLDRNPDPLKDRSYDKYVHEAPLFEKKDNIKLREFLESIIRKGDDMETIFIIDQGKLRPSKSLQDALASMMKGNKEFTMIDTQKVIFELIMDSVRKVVKSDSKKTIIIRGGPGTGKTVLAINLLSRIIGEGISAAYVTKNSAPRHVYNVKLKGGMKKNRIDALFRGSGGFTEAPANTFDVLLVDEAHRLNEKSGLYNNMGENQIKEIINSSRLSVFFIDEDQRVTINDIGAVDEIYRFAEELESSVVEAELDSQFRCAGSDGYLAWIDDTLQIRETASFEFSKSFDYDFRVFDDPNSLRSNIEIKNKENNRSRMVAGYCWNWLKDGKNNSDVHDIVLPEYGFEMSWNLGNSDTWAIDPHSINEMGCIHTCQGLEFDYVGVVIGPDISYDPVKGVINTDATKRAKTDKSLFGLKKRYPDLEERRVVADRIIKNTYRVLMTRGMKGCYVYCTDPELSKYLKERSRISKID